MGAWCHSLCVERATEGANFPRRGASPPFRILPPGFVAPAKPALGSGTLPREAQATHRTLHRPALNVPLRARASPAQPIPGGGVGGGRRGPLRWNAADGPLSSFYVLMRAPP